MSDTGLLQRWNPYPTVCVGGVSVLSFGLVVVVATLFGGGQGLSRIIFPGVGLVVLAYFIAKPRLTVGEPSRRQRLAASGAILLEVVLLVMVGLLLGSDDLRTFSLWILLVVGLHFLPFGFAHGPRTVVLGVLCTLNALLGLWLAGIPFLVFGLADGLLKMGFGGWMLFAPPGSPRGATGSLTQNQKTRASAH